MTQSDTQLTALGTIVVLLIAVTTAKGPWGLFLAFVLAVAIISIAVTHYETLLGYLVKGGK